MRQIKTIGGLLVATAIAVASVAYAQSYPKKGGGGNLTAVNSNLLPAADATYSVGSSTFSWTDIFLTGHVKDGAGTARITIPETSTTTIQGRASAGTTGIILNNGSALTGTDAVVSVRNNGSEKFAVESGGLLDVYGSVVPHTDGDLDFGTATLSWRQAYLTSGLSDSAGTERLDITGSAGNTYTATVANSSTNVSHVYDNTVALSGSTLLASWRSNGSEKAYLTDDGIFVGGGFHTAAGGEVKLNGTAGSVSIFYNSGGSPAAIAVSGAPVNISSGTGLLVPRHADTSNNPRLVTGAGEMNDYLGGVASGGTAHRFGNNTTLSSGTIMQWCPTSNGSSCVGSLDYTGKATFNGGVVLGASGAAITNTLRSSSTIDVASIAAQTCLDTAITVTGAAANNECVVGAPTALTANISATCYVSGSNTVQLRTCNPTGGAIDPASLTWVVRVFAP